MYERFTDRARKSMQLATIEAQRLREHTLDSGHVLAGILAEGSGLGGTVLKELGVELTSVRNVLADYAESEPTVLAGRLPNSDELGNVLQAAIAIAAAMKHNHVGTEHVLLAIVRTDGCVGRAVLTDCCKDILAVDEAIMRMLEPDALKRLVEANDPEAAKALTGYIRRELLDELRTIDARADAIRRELKLDARDEVLWSGDEGDHEIEVVADGYGGAHHVRYDGSDRPRVEIQRDHFPTIAEACRDVEKELGLMEGVCDAG